MAANLQLQIDPDGHPFAVVPHENIWDLVEFLSFQRVHAQYDYSQSNFIVHFPTMDHAAAESMLHLWLHPHELQQPA